MNVNKHVAVLVENASTIKYLKLSHSVNGRQYRVYTWRYSLKMPVPLKAKDQPLCKRSVYTQG